MRPSDVRSFHAVHAVQPDFFHQLIGYGIDVLLAADVHRIDADSDGMAARVHGLPDAFVMRNHDTAVWQVDQLAPAVLVDDGKAAAKVLDASGKMTDGFNIESHMSRRPAGQRRDVNGQAVDAGNESVHLVDDPVHAAPESILDALPDAGSRLADAVHGPVPGRSNPLHPSIHSIRHCLDGLFDILRNCIPVAPEEIQHCDEGSDDNQDGIGHRCCADCPDNGNHHPAHGQEGTAHAFGNNGDASRHRDEPFELDS